MKLFGLTGGIGMGKSACAALLRKRGVAVIDTDDLARDLVQPGQPALAEIADAFGPAVLDGAGQLRRDVLADRVFQDATARQRLETILHPRIMTAWIALAGRWRGEGIPLGVVVIPLLFETAAESHFDVTVCVACTPRTQSIRLAARGWSEEEVARRGAAQWPVDQKMARSQFVIWTEGGLDVHAAQIDRAFRL